MRSIDEDHIAARCHYASLEPFIELEKKFIKYVGHRAYLRDHDYIDKNYDRFQLRMALYESVKSHIKRSCSFFRGVTAKTQ